MALRARIIKSDNCPRCKSYLERLKKLKFEHLIYNVDDATPEQKKDLDGWRIIDMPVVQIVDDEGKVVDQMPFVATGWSPRAIKHRIKEIEDDN